MSINHTHEFFIQWHLTERCNLRCKHCYQTGRGTDEMSLSEIKEVVSEVSDMIKAWTDNYDIAFTPSFNITGGEPLLRYDIFEIIDEVRKQEFDVYLLSNGIFINKDKAKRLVSLGIKGVQVSIEGPKEIHEMIRGKDSFSSSLNGVRNLLDAGVKVTLNTTLSDVNAGYFMEIVDLSSYVGVQRLGFSRLVPSGRGEGFLDKMLGKEKVKELYKKILSLNTNGVEIVTGDPVASQMSCRPENNDLSSIPSGGCAAGVSGLTILPDGTITPCRRLHIPIGNVRQDSLREIWASSSVLKLLRDRSSYNGKCGNCDRWTVCRGCRAIAYAYSRSKGKNDFLAEDPQCFIDKINNE